MNGSLIGDEGVDLSRVGRVLNIQRFALHDGPGVRTTVFLKGCPLSCAWCQNPESIAAEPQIMYAAARCAGCRACEEACRQGAHRFDGEGHVYDRLRCVRCGACAAACPAGALELAGREQSVGAVLDEVQRDVPYYAESGGGLTISGGEPLVQPAFTAALARQAAARALHTCLDTTGFAPWAALEPLVAVVDLFLYDVKLLDDGAHRRWTGRGNELILANLERLVAAGAAVELRCPIIPTVNDTDDHLDALARLVGRLGGGVGCAILPYHTMARSKYDRLGMVAPLGDLPSIPPQRAQQWVDALRRRGVDARL
ncbi:MAG: glycyl-radical enzyme activating protein [Planctomycetes bacterium]|nr:glycyl-radical enzyme activating protein [Planctomycetota bacterium]